MTAPSPSAERSRPEGLLTAALALLVAIPVLVAGVRLAARWYPTFDDAVIAHRGFDVFSRHTPLVGQFSLAGATGPSTHSPGPMLFWLTALPARGPDWSLPMTLAVVNALCFALVVVLARRRAGLGVAAVVAVGCLALIRALGPVSFAEIWNPWVGLAPLLLLVFLVWSVIDGDRWMLPFVALVGSFTLQSHLSLLFPSLALLALAVGWGWGPAVVRRRWRSVPWWPLGVAGIVVAICWALPIVDQLTGDPGNATLLVRSGQEPGGRGGVEAVRATLWRGLGIPPTWLRGEPDPFHFATLSFRPGGWAQALHTGAVLVLFGWVAWRASRARDHLVLTLLAVAGALIVGMVLTAFTIPLDRGLVAGYTFRWFAIASFVVWLGIGLGLYRLLLAPAWRARVAARHTEGDRAVADRWTPARLGVVAVVGVGLLSLAATTLLPWKDQFAFSYRPGRDLADLVLPATRPGGRYLVGNSGRWDLGFTPVLAYELRRNGRHPVAMRTRIEALGEQYAPDDVRCDGILILQEPGDVPTPGARRLGVVAVPDSGFLARSMIVSVRPDDGPDPSC